MTNPVVERLRALGQHPGMTAKGQRDCEDGVREIERLRAALERIASPHKEWMNITEAAVIAREALGVPADAPETPK